MPARNHGATADYGEKIPNNVQLHEDRRLQRALESWQPNFLNWWQTMGPTLPTQDVYLRTAVNVGRDGWAQFGHVPMPEYRWGIFLAERDPGRKVGFGESYVAGDWRPGAGTDLGEVLAVFAERLSSLVPPWLAPQLRPRWCSAYGAIRHRASRLSSRNSVPRSRRSRSTRLC